MSLPAPSALLSLALNTQSCSQNKAPSPSEPKWYDPIPLTPTATSPTSSSNHQSQMQRCSSPFECVGVDELAQKLHRMTV
ncbi:MAG: hypothetical protein MHM6MM_003525 [Cercozoa sp. M6MM]